MSVYNWQNRRPARFTRRGGTSPSPIFLAIVVVFAAACASAYTGRGSMKLAVFVMVVAGWVMSLCLHEYGHALTAYRGGDSKVRDQGYLTLNPLRYTHPVLSIVMPLVFLLLGGIPLPGGAVYIEHYNLRGKWWDSAVSLAGPVANALCAVVLLIAVHFAPANAGLLAFFAPTAGHSAFWAGLSVLAWFQIFAAILNILPIPPLDGYGVIEPHLPPEARRIGQQAAVYGWLIIFVLLWEVPGVNHLLQNATTHIGTAFGLDPVLQSAGYNLFHFWNLSLTS